VRSVPSFADIPIGIFMVDIESLSDKPDALVCAIGAVAFKLSAIRKVWLGLTLDEFWSRSGPSAGDVALGHLSRTP